MTSVSVRSDEDPDHPAQLSPPAAPTAQPDAVPAQPDAVPAQPDALPAQPDAKPALAEPAESAGEARHASPDILEHGPERTPFNVKKAVLVGVVATLVAAGAGLWVFAKSGDVPSGTRVLGVDLGGKSRTAAERALGERVAGLADNPASVRLDGKGVQLAPADVGLRIDVGASVERATHSGGWFAGSRDVLPVVRLDQDRLAARLRQSLDYSRLTFRRPGISFAGLTAVAAYPQAGLDLDPHAAAETVRLAWPLGATAEVPLVRRTSVTTAAQVDALINELARPAVAAPVTVLVGSAGVRLTPAAIAAGLVFRSDDAGRLTPLIDGPKLHAAAAAEFARVETPSRPARIVLRGGRPQIVAGLAGRVVDLDRLGTDLLPVLARPAPRTAPGATPRTAPGVTPRTAPGATPRTGPPLTDEELDAIDGTVLAPGGTPRTLRGTLVPSGIDVSGDGLARLGIRERVSTFTTYFTGGRRSPRSRNIVTVAAAVDGAIVRPGQTFSLNAHTGERGYAAGYRDAPVIVDGKLVPGVGGGASQFTTTLFNAAYYAGLQDVEHKPHSFYFDRYPAVIESTIFYPTLDLKFRNTTPYGILIDTATSGSAVTVSLWSTRVFDSVKTEYGRRRDPTRPPTVHRPAGPRCLTSSGLTGFTQDAWRVIRKDGREVERQKFTWRYDPEPRFVCGGTP